jgi:hypothetical protein
VYDLVRLRRIADVDVDSLTGRVRLVRLNITATGARQKEKSNHKQQGRAAAQSLSSSAGSERDVACTMCSTRFPQHDGRLLWLKDTLRSSLSTPSPFVQASST